MSRLQQSVAVLCLIAATTARAHIGSPDTFVQTTAGPYAVLLSVHPPTAYPGAVEVDLRALGSGLAITSITAALDANPQQLLQSFDSSVYTASLWTPTPSAHALHLRLTGQQGGAALDLALPANATAPVAGISHRAKQLDLVFAVLMVLLAVIVLSRRAQTHRHRVLAAIVLFAAAMLLVFAYRAPRPPDTTQLDAQLSPTGTLRLTLTHPKESFLDLVPDHGKLLHLFLIRQPRLDVLIHLHPMQDREPNEFHVQLPALPPGDYTLYADLYHATGVEDTAVLNLGLPGQYSSPTPLAADDSFGNVAPISTAAAPQP